MALSSSPCAITHLHLQGCIRRQKTLQLPVCIWYHRRAGLTGIISCCHCWQGHFQKRRTRGKSVRSNSLWPSLRRGELPVQCSCCHFIWTKPGGMNPHWELWLPTEKFNHLCYTVMIKCSCHFFEKCTLHIRCKILLLVSPRLQE